jgi:hypothetical protein
MFILDCQLFYLELMIIMSEIQKSDAKEIIEIRISGNLDQDWSDWFDNFQITNQENETILTGSVQDQAALFGLLTKLYSLGLRLISLQRIRQK